MGPYVDGIRRIAANEREFYRLLEELQNETLNDLINRALVVIDFKKDGKRQIPASYVEEVISRTLQSGKYGGDRSKLHAEIRANGWSEREYRQSVEENIIYEYMRDQQRRSETVISPAKVEAHYNANLEKYQQPDSARLRLITFARAPGVDDTQLLVRVQAVLTRLKAGEKFDAIARELTDIEAHRAKGGDLGWNKKSDLKPEFAGAAFTSAIGEVNGPIVTPEGAYLLLVEDRKTAGRQPLKEVNGEIQQELAAQIGREAEARWIARLRANAFIQIYPPEDPPPAHQ
jgi:peptidyl-prolyl cis-trans isomerase SurA